MADQELEIKFRMLLTGNAARDAKQFAEELRKLNQQQIQSNQLQLEARRMGLASGNYARQVREETRIRTELLRIEQAELRVRSQLRQEHVRSGEYGQNYATRMQMLRTEADVRRQEAQAEARIRIAEASSPQGLAGIRSSYDDAAMAVSVQRAEAAAKRAIRQERIDSGATLGDVRSNIAEQRQEADIARRERAVQEQAEVEERIRRVRSGEYGAEVEQARKSDKLRRDVEAMERKAANLARYGRVGGGLVNASQSLPARIGGGIATAGLASVTASAMAGFSGTVEMHRMQMELTFISRQLAGSLKPAIDVVTGGLSRLRVGLERMGPATQSLLGVTLGAGIALKTASMISNRLFHVGLIEAGASVASHLGGRAALNAAVQGGANGLSQILANAGASSAAQAASNWAANRATMPKPSPVIGMPSTNPNASPSNLGSNLAQGGLYAAVAAAALNNLYQLKATRDVAREKGFNWESSLRGAIPGAGLGLDIYRGMFGDKTAVTTKDAGFEAIGSAYDRFTIERSLSDNSMAQKNADNLQRIADAVDKTPSAEAPPMTASDRWRDGLRDTFGFKPLGGTGKR